MRKINLINEKSNKVNDWVSHATLYIILLQDKLLSKDVYEK